jgi:methylphosphotriester-DNA--protein-cysteine methyltransferase
MIEDACIDKSGGVLQLLHRYAGRTFCTPGKRLRLEGRSYYPDYMNGTGLDELWMCCTVPIVTGVIDTRTRKAPFREGEAHVLTADGQFVYAVKTTGVYCQPSSPSRLPRPENVEFFETPADAEAAGYRPSRRAGPDQTTVRAQQTALVAQACRRIEAADTPPTLDALAQDASLSPYHFHRLFKSVTGLTPKAYLKQISLRART